jgi:hypothetical protein
MQLQGNLAQLHCELCQVTKATKEEFQDEQRLRLIVNFKGTVISASSSTSKTLFGLDPAADLVGKPLASFITQFEQFRVQQRQGTAAGVGFAAAAAAAPQSEGGDGSGQPSQRYSQIALQLQRDISHVEQAAAAAAGDLDQLLLHSGAGSTGAADDDSVLLSLLGQAAQEGGDATYRVGVRSVPVADGQIGWQRTKEGSGKNSSSLPGGAAAAAGSATGGGSSAGVEGLWASMVGGKSVVKTHAAVMAVSVVEQDLSSSGAATTDNVQFEVRRGLGVCRFSIRIDHLTRTAVAALWKTLWKQRYLDCSSWQHAAPVACQGAVWCASSGFESTNSVYVFTCLWLLLLL